MKNIYLISFIAVALIGCNNSTPDTSADPETPSLQVNTPQSAPDEFRAYSEQAQSKFIKCGVDEDEFYRLIGLSYRDFDQDFKGGWRAIDYKDGCKIAAQNMLKSYLTYHAYKHHSERSMLLWHTGQVLAGDNKYDEAVKYFRQTYKSGDHSTEWNLYVDATIAFLRKDKSALITARDTLALQTVSEEMKASRRGFLKQNSNVTMPNGFVDEPQNLSVVNKLIKCYDEPYSVAYGKCAL